MVDDRDYHPEDEDQYQDTDATEDAEPSLDFVETIPGDDVALLSEEEFDQELNALEGYAPDDEAEASETPATETAYADYGADETAEAEQAEADLSATDEEDRLRPPRAQSFRRRLRNQIGVLPLALYFLALGGLLIARQQDVEGVPDFSALAVGEISALAVAFTAVFHAFMSGRRERGLLFSGLWVWITAGMLFVLIYGIDDHAQATRWWPLLLWSLSLTMVVTYLIERAHDVRLVWLAAMTLLAGGIAYGFTSDRIDAQQFDRAAEYWPLLLAVVGVGLLPLAFRRRAE